MVTLPHPRGPTRRPLATVTAAAAELRRRGWTADEVEYDAGIEPDPRLRVAPGADAPAVELLLPVQPGAAGCWVAVRVTTADRAVWSGPPDTCPLGTLVAFLESLALRPEAELAADYHRLG